MRRTLSLVLFAVAMLAVGSAAFTAPDTAIPFPDDYRHWTHVKSILVGPQSAGFATQGGYHHFYANQKAMEGYRTGTFPDGAILIDDGVEAVEKDGVTTAGPRRRVAVMVKDSRRFPNSRNWGFELFPGDGRDGSLDEAGRAACLACHQRAERDLVYSQFRR